MSQNGSRKSSQEAIAGTHTMRVGDTRPAASGRKQSSRSKEVATGSFLSSSNVSAFPFVARSLEDFFPPSAPRLGGALPRLYRTVLVVAGSALLFLCLTVRFMAFDDDSGGPRCGGNIVCSGGGDTVVPEATASTWNQTMGRGKAETPLSYPTESAATEGDGQDSPCASAELRPCTRRDMAFTVHYSHRRRSAAVRGGSCVQLAPDANRCLAGPNRFRTMRACKNACSHSAPSSTVTSSTLSEATANGTTHLDSRKRQRRCGAGPSFVPCSLGHRRSSNFVFESGRCVSLHGSCTDGGFVTLRECRSTCLEEQSTLMPDSDTETTAWL